MSISKRTPQPDSFQRLMSSVKLSEATKKGYLMRVKQYLTEVEQEPDKFVSEVKAHPKKFEESFINFVQRTSEKSSASTTTAFRDSVKRFLELSRVENVNWEYINEFVPTAKKAGEDRAPTLAEIRKIVDIADLRMKCLVLFLCSSGSRIGSAPLLRWKDVKEVEVGGEKFAKVSLHHGKSGDYTSFVTPECYQYLLRYEELRESIGERVTEASYVFVTEVSKEDFQQSRVGPVSVKTFKNLLGRLLKQTGMRQVISERGSYKNYEFKQAHGFRKFFKTRLEVAGVKPLVIEMLMGHSTGVSKSYFKPTDSELANEFTKAIDELTIIKGKQEVTKDSILATFNKQYLVMAGYSDEEVSKLGDLSQLGPHQVQELIRSRNMQSLGLNGNNQKVIGMGEVESYVSHGWDFVSSLPDGKGIVRLPGHAFPNGS